MLVDFSEISDSRQFEDLVCDLLEKEGFFVEERSGKGQDEGRDILVVGHFQNTIDKFERRYLVQCKSWKTAVSEKEVPNIKDKISQHGADGFLLVAYEIKSSLQHMLDGLKKNKVVVEYWIRRDLQNLVIKHQDVFKKHLPLSFDKFFGVDGLVPERDIVSLFRSSYDRNPKPTELFSWRRDTMVYRIADVNVIKRALEDKNTLDILNSLYQKLLGRKVDPVGHFTWGYRLYISPSSETKRFIESQIRNSDEYLARSRFLYIPDSLPEAQLKFSQPLTEGFYGWRPYHINYSEGILRTAPSTLPPHVELESMANKELRLEWRLGRNIPNKGFLAIDVGFEGSFQVFVLLLGADRKPYFLQYIFDKGNKKVVEDSGVLYAQHFVGKDFPFDEVVPNTLERNMNRDLKNLCNTTVGSVVSLMFGVKGKAKIARIYLTEE